MTYFLIFIFKIIEDALATLRLIVVSNGKKWLGAILQFFVTLIWILLTGTVLLGLNEDIGKGIALAFGAFFGSYLGSFIEEKIALGTNVFITSADINTADKIILKLKSEGFDFYKIESSFNKVIICIIAPRKKRLIIKKIINNINRDITIFSEKIKLLN